MSYVGDWYNTSDDEQTRLKAICADPACGHMRYAHGDVRITRNGYYRFVTNEPGSCTNCGCKIFWAETPITTDDVLDVAVALRYDVRLADVGVAPLNKEKCAQLTIRHTGAGQFTAACLLERNHGGEHQPDWADLHAAD